MIRKDTINKYFQVVLMPPNTSTPAAVIQAQTEDKSSEAQEAFTEEPLIEIIEEAKAPTVNEEEEVKEAIDHDVKVAVMKEPMSETPDIPPALFILNPNENLLSIFSPSLGSTVDIEIVTQVFKDSAWCLIPFSRKLMICGGSCDSDMGNLYEAITLDTESRAVDALPSM